MFFRQIYDEKLAEAAYLIGCQKSGEAIVIDPERDIDRYEQVAAANGLRIVAVAETHIHADFLSGGREFAEKGARIYVSDEGDADWKYQWLDKKSGGGRYDAVLLKDGDTFKVGNIEFRAVHTPGHTPEHLCYMVTDRGGGANEPMGVATGDYLFVGDLGRPDLLESAAGIAGKADPSAHRLYQTVKRTESWPDWLQVWPGHGAGSACGKALGAVPQTTVGYERRFNPALRAAESEQSFVDFILDGQPEPPLYFARMKRDNKMGPAVLGGLPKPREMSAAEVARLDTKRTAVIDTRAWNNFRDGHLAGSLFAPLANSFNADAGSFVDEGEEIVLIVEPARVEEAVRDLVRIGLDKVVGWFDAARFAEIAAAGGRTIATPEIAAADARAYIDARQPFVLDVRRAAEFANGAIDGALNAAHTRLRSRLADLPRSRELLVHCQGGVRSARACALLERHGFTVTNMAGGYGAYARHAQPSLAKA
ncbi:MAG: MBL fold metallo-hydrolase [Phycisphaerales bacterium]